ncbi:MAG: UDP-N-acetylmuramoyl-tripeptide--D-alanyl-D-alanine ligase [Marinilabiliales bacterium]|nr:MAG: UDP-N-acetylmuramoyl-tripeptide--D-alanyl-D-alanine ligase [Marinilabiliales bacterium]
MDLENIYNLWKQSTGISTDSRTCEKSNLFFALSGENFNGNKFAEKAIDNGAIAAVIDDVKYKNGPEYILVNNCLKTLQLLSKLHRNKLNTSILAITGSNGKTTTKELIYSVLSSQKKISFTKGNLNNHIGVPLSLLQTKQDTEIAIIEMGANHIGEIAFLCELASPNYGIITNIGKAHLEGFGSLQGVIKAKSELYNSIKNTGGEIILNNDDKLLKELSTGIKSFTYGTTSEANITAEIISSNPALIVDWKHKGSKYTIQSHLYGQYNFPNIMAAIASGIFFGISPDAICRAIENYIPENSRSQILKTKNNTILLDAYNANPVSMNGAIISFREFKAEKPLLILGDMFELGKDSEEEHKQVINNLENTGFSEVFLVGSEFYKFAGSNNFRYFEKTSDLKNWLKSNKLKDFTILIKGSRGMKLELILDNL